MNPSSAIALVSAMPGAAIPDALSAYSAVEMASSFLSQPANSAKAMTLYSAPMKNRCLGLLTRFFSRFACLGNRLRSFLAQPPNNNQEAQKPSLSSEVSGYVYILTIIHSVVYVHITSPKRICKSSLHVYRVNDRNKWRDRSFRFYY